MPNFRVRIRVGSWKYRSIRLVPKKPFAGLKRVAEVNRLFPHTPALSIGHLSSKEGGWLRPHRSHQNGRDVDLGFYYNDGARWYSKATPENLDVPRTWALLSALERAAGLEYAFVDQSLHQVLRQYAESIGESQEFLEHMFDGPLPVRGPTIRHERGHLDSSTRSVCVADRG